VLLIFVSMQIIGVYFVQKLEDQMVSNFEKSIKERVGIILFAVQGEINKTRTGSDEKLEVSLRQILSKYSSEDIEEIMVVDTNTQIIGMSTMNDQALVGKVSRDDLIKRTLTSGVADNKPFVQESSGDRIWILAEPIKKGKETIGCIRITTKIEKVYKQIENIKDIMQTGTLISLVITAVLGLIVSEMITRPISELRKQALAMSKGNYFRKARIFGNDEIGQLASTFNSLSRKLQDAQSTTEAEKRKLSSVLAYMSDGVIATDRKGNVILINQPALKMLEVTNEEALTKTITELLDIESEFDFDSLLERKDSLVLDYGDRYKKFYLRANFSAIKRETGFVNGLITVLHDSTEQEKVEDERKEFVANVSHELRTPLTTMRSYLEALSEGAIKNEKLVDKFLGVVREETERMIRLVNALLNLSNLENGTGTINLYWIDFGKFFNKIIDRFEMTKDRQVTFKREIPETPIFVEIDPDKINQVIDNIISNALKYSPEGGQITFKVQVLEKSIEVSVRDQGMGMPKGNVEKIFQRFYRVDKARSRKLGGTGLGLAIAKEIITNHQGTIIARSIEGVGTTIIFSLPYESSEDEWE
ncbi:MAG: walK, partial [Bacillales bacterium]|nr:walK [Bacillales bacterium]